MSTIATNTITNVAGNATGVGIAVSNAATYNSDGGAVTQNLVQGLIKASMDLDGTGTIALNDSLNISGVTDNTTGNYSPAYTNNFANVFYGWGGNGEFPSTGYSGRAPHCISDYNTTSNTRLGCGYQFGLEDCEHVRLGWWGDLA